MTFEEWNAEPYSRTFEDAWKAGAESRDAEVADIHAKFDARFAAYLEDRAALIFERDQLREQVTLLRDKVNKYLPECDHYSDNGVKFYTELLEALAATEPKE